MKKLFTFAVAVLLTGFAFTSCGDDDDTDYSQVEAVFTVSPETQMEPNMTVNIYTEPPKTDGVFYTWYFGDGSIAKWQNDGTAFQNVLVHTYEKSGEYTITLSVLNRGGYSAEMQKTVKIIPAEPVALVPPVSGSGIAPYTFELQNGVMYADSVKWNIKSVVDEKESPVAEFFAKADARKSFTFETPGDYLLYLTAYGAGAKDGKYIRTDTVYVKAAK